MPALAPPTRRRRRAATRLRTLLAAAVLWLSAGAAQAEPPVWVVHGDHCKVVLFGSVHILPPNVNWEPRRLKSAVAHAREIWFEIPLDNASMAAAAEAAERAGVLPPGQSLLTQLTPADQSRLTALAQAYAVPVAELDQLKPWLAEIRLSVASYRDLGASRELGVEHQILSEARRDALQRAFETPDEQIGYLASGAPADQIASLEETFKELEEGPAGFHRLINAWLAGDLKTLSAEALDPMIKTSPAIYRELVADRNARWVQTITARLNQPGDAVMVVGVGHLIGPDGLPALLRAKGIKVDGP